MPRETIEINDFSGGVNWTADPLDLPLNTSPMAINVEPAWMAEGVLRGIKKTTNVITPSTSPTIPNIGYARGVGYLARADGNWDMIYCDATNGNTYAVLDVEANQATPTYKQLGAIENRSSSIIKNTPAFIEDGNTLRLGQGPYETASTRWIGYITSQNFGAPQQMDPQMLEDRCIMPGEVPFLSKICTDGTYLYGIAADNRGVVYKIKISDNTFTTSRPGDFNNIRSICYNESNQILLLCKSSTGYTVQIVGTSDLLVDATITSTSFSFDWAELELTDIEYTSGGGTVGTIWVLATGGDKSYGSLKKVSTGKYGGPTEDLLWKCTPADWNGGSLTFTDVTPDITVTLGTTWDTGTAGNFYGYQPSGWFYGYGPVTVIDSIPRYGLVKLSTTQIAIAFNAQNWINVVNSPDDSVELECGPFYHAGAGNGYPTWPVSHPDWVMIQGKMNYAIVNTSTTKGSDILSIIVSPTTLGYYATSYYWLYSGNGMLLQVKGNVIQNWDVDTIPVTPQTRVIFTTVPRILTSRYSLGSIATSTTNMYIARSSQNVSSGYNEEQRQGYSWAVFTDVNIASPVWTNGSEDKFNSAVIQATKTDNGTVYTFNKNKWYHYKVCLEFDGFQYSPLSSVLVTHNAGTNGVSAKVKLIIRDIRNLNRRVTAILLFKAQANSEYGEMLTAYRLVRRFPLQAGAWTVTFPKAELEFIDDISDSGALFEALSGFSETLDHTWVNWSSAVSLNNYLFVSGCYTPWIADANTYVFRSKPYRFSTFDWSKDYVKLPEPVYAISQFAGRVYACAADKTYLINPVSLQVEETVDGMGAMWHHAICQTPEALYIASEKHIWRSDGRTHVQISGPIEGTTYGEDVVPLDIFLYQFPYGNNAWTSEILPRLVYDPITDCMICVPTSPTSSAAYCTMWMFHPKTNTWWYCAPVEGDPNPVDIGITRLPTWIWSFGINTQCSYLSYDVPPVQGWATLFTSSTRAAWHWTTKAIGNKYHYMNYYMVGVIGTGYNAPKYCLDYSGTQSLAHASQVVNGTYIDSWVPTTRRCRFVLVQIYSTHDTSGYPIWVSGLGITIRRMIGEHK